MYLKNGCSPQRLNRELSVIVLYERKSDERFTLGGF